jgi:hypothetical protein
VRLGGEDKDREGRYCRWGWVEGLEEHRWTSDVEKVVTRILVKNFKKCVGKDDTSVSDVSSKIYLMDPRQARYYCLYTVNKNIFLIIYDFTVHMINIYFFPVATHGQIC